MNVKLYRGDILRSRADVVVNPANGQLAHGGGLARRIADAANRKRPFRRNRFQADCDAAPVIPTGGVYMTSSGALRFKKVIHAVGPIWTPGSAGRALRLVEATYLNAVDLAGREGYKSMAFPAISAGIYGVPIDVVAAGAWRALARMHYPWMRVEMWLWTEWDAAAFSETFGTRVEVLR